MRKTLYLNNTETIENKVMTQEKFNQIAAVLIAVVTLLTAIVAYLQRDASAELVGSLTLTRKAADILHKRFFNDML
jgi:hypothetical protein